MREEPLERWEAEAPEPFREAKRTYREDGPSEEQLTRMLARVETAAVSETGSSAPRAPLKPWTWLVSAVGAVGVALLLNAKEPPPLSLSEAPVKPAAPRAPALTHLPLVNRQTDALPRGRGSQGAPTRPKPRVQSETMAELALLERARRVMANDPARALSLTDLHRRRYRMGQFEQERELLAIEALLSLGSVRAAEARAHRFVRSHAESVHIQRLEQLLRSAKSD